MHLTGKFSSHNDDFLQDQSRAELRGIPGRQLAQSKPKVSRRSSQPLHTEWSIKALTPRGGSREIRATRDQAQSADGSEGPAGDLQEHHTTAVSTLYEQNASTAGIRHASAAGPALHAHQPSAALTSNHALLESYAQQEASESGQQDSACGELSKRVPVAGAMLDSRLGKRDEGASSIEEDQRGSMAASLVLHSSPSRARQLGSARAQGLASMASAQELPASSSSFRAQTGCAASAEALPHAPTGGSFMIGEQHQGVNGSRQSMHLDDGLAASGQAHVAGHSGQSVPSRGSPSRRPSTSHFSVHSGSGSPDTRMHVHRYSAQHAMANSDSAPADKQASARVGPSSIPLLGIRPRPKCLAQATPAIWPCVDSPPCQLDMENIRHISSKAHEDWLQVIPSAPKMNTRCLVDYREQERAL